MKAKGKLSCHYVPKAGASALYTKMNEILSLKRNLSSFINHLKIS